MLTYEAQSETVHLLPVIGDVTPTKTEMKTTPTIADLAAAILKASERMSQSTNTRYPFNCTDAAITTDDSGAVYCGTNINPSDDEIVLMDEEYMCSAITPDMSDEDAEWLAEQLLADLAENA